MAQPDDALSDSQQVAHTMNKFPIHQLQANFHRICCCDFKSQSPRGSHEIVHAPEYRPRKQQSEGTDHQRLLHTDLNEIRSGIKLHQHLSPGKIKGLPNRFGASGADGCIDGFNFSLPCNPHNQLTGVGCIVDTKIHRDTPSLGESMQQLINTKCEHEAADEAAFVVYGAVEDITFRVEGLEKFYGRSCDHAPFITGLLEAALRDGKRPTSIPSPTL